MDIDIVTYILYNDKYIEKTLALKKPSNKIQLIKHLKPATSSYPVAVMCFQFAISFLDYL